PGDRSVWAANSGAFASSRRRDFPKHRGSGDPAGEPGGTLFPRRHNRPTSEPPLRDQTPAGCSAPPLWPTHSETAEREQLRSGKSSSKAQRECSTPKWTAALSERKRGQGNEWWLEVELRTELHDARIAIAGNLAHVDVKVRRTGSKIKGRSVGPGGLLPGLVVIEEDARLDRVGSPNLGHVVRPGEHASFAVPPGMKDAA